MATRHATGRLRRPSAMQLNHIDIAMGANKRPIRYLSTDPCAIGSSGWTRNAGWSCPRMLLEGDKPLRLGSRALDTLIALAERPGKLISKNELMERVWPNTHVEES